MSAIEKAKARLAAIKQIETASAAKAQESLEASRVLAVPDLAAKGWRIDDSVQWNVEQNQAISAALAGKSFCLIGAAGTGKTTTVKGMYQSLMMNDMIPPIATGHGTKYLHAGAPGIAIVSFTNMAVRQVAKNFSADVTCVTIHKLLEFAPVYYEVDDGHGAIVKKMKFEPTRNKTNPLPKELNRIWVDESSMVDTELFQLLIDALPDPSSVQFVFLGDLNQLPPVYGGPILGRKLLDLPIVELTTVYRQALLSPIIRYAHDMKNGKGIVVTKKIDEDNGEHGRVIIHPWAKALGAEDALNKAQNFCKAAIKEQQLDIYRDIILCPYNVSFGVLELNSAIADWLGRERGAKVHEVVAGFEQKYLAVGDKVLVQKQEAIIMEITRNGNYSGKRPIDAERFDIDRWGGARLRKDSVSVDTPTPADFDDAAFDVDAFLDSMQTTDITERKHQASHRVKVRFIKDHDKKKGNIGNWAAGDEFSDPDDEFSETVLSSAAELNEMLFGYAITVHKSQGSEWRRVFFLLHRSHAKMCSRELMYTGMTRAREYLYIICEPDSATTQGTLNRAARNPRLKGNTLAEKLVSLKEQFDRDAREKADSINNQAHLTKRK